jgi:hypothetical protein
MEGTNLRRIAFVVIASTVGMVFASTAVADTVTTSNSAVSISASLMNGSDGAFATAGNAVSASASVTNLLDANAYVRIYVIADWDRGWSPTINKLKKMKDGDTWDISGQFKVGTTAWTPPGIYQLRLIADTPGNPLLEADASILVL